MKEKWQDFRYWLRYWFQGPYGWRHGLYRIRRGKKVCRSCFYYPGACLHIDKEVWEALAKRIEEDRLGIRPLPRIKLPPREKDDD